MDTSNKNRKCSAVTRDGQPCQAWAIRGSRPALCSVHAGRNNGGGAPAGNKNALKHGYYTRHFSEQEIATFDELRERSLIGELVLARTMVGRLTAYISRPDVQQEEVERVMPLIFSGLRTIVQIYQINDDDGIDWEEILGELEEEWGVEL